MKKVLHTQHSDSSHWVGDGFLVRTLFGYNDLAKEISPFLLMDYAGPVEFPPSNSSRRRGVDSHPHRGFETVTIVYDGEVEHRDSAGGGGVISDGDVQWMTAASGLVHEEKHGKNFSQNGGRFEMVQLWVNLPKKDKMTTPRYQGLKKASIPKVDLPENSGTLRVIAGKYQGHVGAAQTFSAINLWDIRLNIGSTTEFKVPTGHTAVVFVLDGELKVSTTHNLGPAELAVLDPQGDTFTLTAQKDTKLLFLGGEPLNEPIVGYGPFVMNTKKEIMQAIHDFEEGQMGVINEIEGTEYVLQKK
jgi:hypothetical protein